jgi:hypothetical protein
MCIESLFPLYRKRDNTAGRSSDIAKRACFRAHSEDCFHRAPHRLQKSRFAWRARSMKCILFEFASFVTTDGAGSETCWVPENIHLLKHAWPSRPLSRESLECLVLTDGALRVEAAVTSLVAPSEQTRLLKFKRKNTFCGWVSVFSENDNAKGC